MADRGHDHPGWHLIHVVACSRLEAVSSAGSVSRSFAIQIVNPAIPMLLDAAVSRLPVFTRHRIPSNSITQRQGTHRLR